MNLLPLVFLFWQVASQPPKPCVVLKRMGPADQVTSHLSSFGIRGKQFQYVEGDLPPGVKFHGRLTDNDVRKIRDAGGRVAVVESHYTDQDLEQARKSCGASSSEVSSSGGAPKSESKSQESDSVNQAPTSAAGTTPGPQSPAAAPTDTTPAANPVAPAATAPAPAAQPTPEVSTEDLTTAVVKSDPPGADVTVDGKYMGSTPSTVRLAPGDHTILLERDGFKPWQRTMTVSPGGIVTIDATLAKQE